MANSDERYQAGTGASEPDLPEFGELATPEEQARARSRYGEARPGNSLPSASPAPKPQPRPSNVSIQSNRQGRFDRMATIFLLAVELMFIVSSIGGYLNLGEAMSKVFDQLGMTDYSPPASASTWGIAVLLIQSIIWIVTAVWAYSRLSQLKSAWWIPLVGGIVSFLSSVLVFAILISGDPSVQDFITHQGS